VRYVRFGGDMSVTVAVAGDTMLGRGVAERLAREPPEALWAPSLVEVARAADLFVLNLECCISDRGGPWPAPGKPFFFRAPPAAVEALALLGVDCVTCANNHALDFGADALLDTLGHLDRAGIAHVGAGPDVDAARAPAVLESGGLRLGVVGVTDHPADFAAGPNSPGVAYADLRAGVPDWLPKVIGSVDADAVMVTPHWGPNMTVTPVEHVRAAAPAMLEAGAALVAGHSAHVFHGVSGRVLYDLGDFLDDYAVDANLRNDLGLLWLVELDAEGLVRLEAVPLRLEYGHTRMADGDDRAWIARRFRQACAEFGTDVTEGDGHLVVSWR
jgi:poly-gamma-glutamate capsule biosynthesis protein CapA/YwtB (metallophosphatase superfamily)